MSAMTKILASGVVGVILMSGGADAARADYAVTVIENPTPDPVIYNYRWGDYGPWQTMVLQPYSSMSHWYVMDNFSPVPYLNVSFDFDRLSLSPNTVRNYSLSSYRSFNTNSGKIYQFTSYSGGNLLDLVNVN